MDIDDLSILRAFYTLFKERILTYTLNSRCFLLKNCPAKCGCLQVFKLFRNIVVCCPYIPIPLYRFTFKCF